MEGDGIETFSLGDTIRVELDLRDESGVSTVSAVFYGHQRNSIPARGS